MPLKKFRISLKISDIKVYEVEAINLEAALEECFNNESLIPVVEYPEVPEIYSSLEIK